MVRNTNSVIEDTAVASNSGDLTASDASTEFLRAGTQKMLKAAVEQEATEYITDRTNLTDKHGRRLVVRNR